MAGDPRPGRDHDRGVENPEKLLPCKASGFQRSRSCGTRIPWTRSSTFLIADPSTGVAVFGMSQPDVTLALQQPWVAIDNDSEGTSPEGILGQAHPHPRAYGTFPRILRKYVREEKALTLEDAIRKFSALPAQRMRLTDRGVLKAGMWADVVVFDPATIRDRATFDNPNQLSEGMEYVLVNGVPVVDHGKMTGALPGKVLRTGVYFAGGFNLACVSAPTNCATRGCPSVPLIANPGTVPLGFRVSRKSSSPCRVALPLT
jgi:hypothetical protein